MSLYVPDISRNVELTWPYTPYNEDDPMKVFKLEQAKLDMEHQLKLLGINNQARLYGGEIESDIEKGYIGEPTPTQFQEAHKKWRRILEEKNEKIKELELALKEKEAAKTIKWNLHKVVVEELESQIKQLKSNSLNGKLKEEVDKLRMSNQEKDIEIQELRDQVTQQAAKWLVPNFK